MTALAARGVRKSFGRRQVLTGLDLEVAVGELVAAATGTHQPPIPIVRR